MNLPWYKYLNCLLGFHDHISKDIGEFLTLSKCIHCEQCLILDLDPNSGMFKWNTIWNPSFAQKLFSRIYGSRHDWTMEECESDFRYYCSKCDIDISKKWKYVAEYGCQGKVEIK